MSEPFVGEIRAVPYGFVPKGFAECDGRMLGVSQNTQLFAVIGTNFGGNGTTTFALPDLRARAPLGMGDGPGLTSYYIGDSDGTPAVTLTEKQLGNHGHRLQISSRGAVTGKPDGQLFAVANGVGFYGDAGGAATALAKEALGPTGGRNAHNNMMPFLALQHVIALSGVFPNRSGE